MLSHIRRASQLPKASLARLTGLSPTAVTGIVRNLEADGLLQSGQPQRGKVGQPSVPFALNPDGALSLGLKIGRRSAEIALLDAAMCSRGQEEISYRVPEPDRFVEFFASAHRRLLPSQAIERLVGLGVAMPTEIWSWAEEAGMSDRTLDQWRTFDLAGVCADILPAPVTLVNDATAACAAQLALDPPSAETDGGPAALSFVYFFVGWFIGGGVVLNGELFEGASGNAGALGSMLVAAPDHAEPVQLIRTASLYRLEREQRAKLPASELPFGQISFSEGTEIEQWIEGASAGIAQAIAASTALVDCNVAVIDGSFPDSVRARIVARTIERFASLDRQGLRHVTIREGSLGRGARSIGAACIPMLAALAVDGASVLQAVKGNGTQTGRPGTIGHASPQTQADGK